MSTTSLLREPGSPVVRVPLYFGPSERALFGWLHIPPEATRGTLAVVVCPPLDHEYMNSHRAMRHLADQLAAAGMPALRFDYQGTGDSSGNNEDPHRVPAWLESIDEAVQALRVESGCAQIGLVGLRMGATLAAIASRRVDVSCLVLWAPCVRGRTYLRELKAMDFTGERSAPRSSSRIEAGGYVTTEETQRDISAINLDQDAPVASRVLIVSRDDLPESDSLLRHWQAAGLPVDRWTLPGYADMLAVPHRNRVPEQAVDEIVGWLSAGSTSGTAKQDRTGAVVPDSQAIRQRSLLVDNVRESFVRFGENGELFGILSVPEDASLATATGAPTVLLPNAGSTHHVGPSRLYVLLARRLSQAGFRCIRLDLPSLGDSVADHLDAENNPYVPESSAAIAAVMKTLSARPDQDAYVVMGLCSGAHAAFHAALDLDQSPIVESVLINPLTFYYTPGMSLDQPAAQSRVPMAPVHTGPRLTPGLVETVPWRHRHHENRWPAIRAVADDCGRDDRRLSPGERRQTERRSGRRRSGGRHYAIDGSPETPHVRVFQSRPRLRPADEHGSQGRQTAAQTR